MLRRLFILGLLATSSGCFRATPVPPTPKPTPLPAPVKNVPQGQQGFDPLQALNQPPPPPPAKEGTGGVGRTMEITDSRNYLRQLGIAYKTFELEQNRGPRDRKEFSPYFENNAKMIDALDKGDLVFHYNVSNRQMPDPANTLLAYEGVKDRNGIRVVLMGNGQIQDLDDATFQNLPKAGKR